jgi:CMP-N,N'-diacetyllegionaminic acid synthase
VVIMNPTVVDDLICDEVWGFVPARSGSKGVPDKNMQEVQGVSLLGLAVLAATHCPSIDHCFVSTDSESYADEARRYGAEVPFLRPQYASTDTSTDADAFQHFLDWAMRNLKRLPWAIVHLRPTTPCREPAQIERVVDFARLHRESASAIRSAHVAPESPFKWFLKDSEGFLTTFNRSRNLDASNRARAEFEDVYVPNGYVDIVFPANVIGSGLLHGDSVLPFSTEPVIEVDSQFELDLLRRTESIPRELLEAAIEAVGYTDVVNWRETPES